MSKYCVGCGALLQDKLEFQKGYVKDLEMKYCERCFRIKHYHELKKIEIKVDNKELLNQINKQKGFAFFFCDFLNLYPENIFYYHQVKMPKVFLVTKSDTIPKSISYEKIRLWLKKYYSVKEEILFVSKKNPHKLEDLIEKNPYPSLYFLGPTNAGKSTMIDSLLKSKNLESFVTMSEFPNTTLNFLKIPYNGKQIYDTIGFVKQSIVYEEELLKKVNVKKEIKPIGYPVSAYASFIVDDFFRVSFDTKVNVIWYGSENLKIRKVYEKNKSLLDKEKNVFSLNSSTNVFLKGIGFFYVKDACTMTIYGVSKESICITPSFLGGRND